MSHKVSYFTGQVDESGNPVRATTHISGTDNVAAFRQQDAANVANYYLAKQQNDWNVEEWQREFDLTNEYNSPSAQLERLKAAGLNPMYFGLEGSNSNASQSLVQSSNMANQDAAPVVSTRADRLNAIMNGVNAIGGSINSSLNSYFQRRKLDSEISKIDSEVEINKVNKSYIESQTELTREQKANLEQQTRNLTAQYNEILAKTDVLRNQKAIGDKELQYFDRRVLASISKDESLVKNIQAQTNLTDKQSKLVIAETTGVVMKNALLGMDLDLQRTFFETQKAIAQKDLEVALALSGVRLENVDDITETERNSLLSARDLSSYNAVIANIQHRLGKKGRFKENYELMLGEEVEASAKQASWNSTYSAVNSFFGTLGNILGAVNTGVGIANGVQQFRNINSQIRLNDSSARKNDAATGLLRLEGLDKSRDTYLRNSRFGTDGSFGPTGSTLFDYLNQGQSHINPTYHVIY
ncbi:minor capsid protein [Capybara microvirus Cap1_SP_109]|nr:minor capsid protein [Capybara microvirus Cap1_SP_109]